MKSSRLRRGGRQRSPLAHGRRSPLPEAGTVSILAHIISDPAHVAAALCQMATLAHAAGRASKRDESVVVATELLAHREEISPRTNRALLNHLLPC